jgi:hypothetical protein
MKSNFLLFCVITNIFRHNFSLKLVCRRMVIVKEEDKPVDVIPQEFAARTLAQEYGGGAFAVNKNVVVFSNYKDQRLYKQEIGSK